MGLLTLITALTMKLKNTKRITYIPSMSQKWKTYFLVEELIRLFANHLERNPDEVFANIKDYVINSRFAKQIKKQICQSVVARLKYELASIEIV